MNSPQIFGLQFALNLIVFALIARWYIAPRLSALPLHAALTPLLLLHAMRTVGMVFIVPAVVDPNLPRDFAVPATYGDLLAVLLALAALAALRARLTGALVLVWIFNIEGTVDFLYALYQGLRLGLTDYQLGVAWYIPTFIVPALLVTHIMIYALLLKRSRHYRAQISRTLTESRM
jgi:hypothetical protein